jgi:3-methyladenine DNA glycosylase AlkD
VWRIDKKNGRKALGYMNSKEATSLGSQVGDLLQAGRLAEAHRRLRPILESRTPFTLLDRIGGAIGQADLTAVNEFLKQMAAGKTMGGWVIIGSALGQQLDRDLQGAFERCRSFVIAGDVWYATDTLGERVPGPALVHDFEPALSRLAAWRQDQNRWVRRTVGVSAHFWAKRSRGAPEKAAQAEQLLALLEPMFGEQELDAVKGIGWGLKTLGKYYPDLTSEWLRRQVAMRPYRALMLRKALTYLPPQQRARVEKAKP